jgi:hypothetical protein
LPRAAAQPRKGAKAVFNILGNAKPGEVNKWLKHVARLFNVYGAARLITRDVKTAAIPHGEADKAVRRVTRPTPPASRLRPTGTCL